MELHMYNVGFGDFFLLRGPNASAIVDCGTARFVNARHSNLYALANHVISTIPRNEPVSAIITHFHNDHYSGFKSLGRNKPHLFSEVLVPYIIMDSKTKRLVIIELAIYFYTFLKQHKQAWGLSQDILKSLDILLRLTKPGRIRFLATGDKFSIDNKNFEVLWPDKTICFDEILGKLSKYLDEFDKSTERYIKFHEIRKSLIKSFMLLFEMTEVKSQAHIIKEIARAQSAQMRKLAKFSDSLTVPASAEIITDSIKYYGTGLFSRSVNATSLVFHSIDSLKSDCGILMTGDVERRIIDNFLKPRFCRSYEILKAPHHGTEEHYSENLPAADAIFISSGIRNKYGKISHKYESHKNYGKLVCCTPGPANCEAYLSHNKCPNGYCAVPRGQDSLIKAF